MDRKLKRRWHFVPVCTLAGAVGLALISVPAQAASSYTVPIPLHPVASDLRLIGASDEGVAVERTDIDNGLAGGKELWTGPVGGDLTFRPELNLNVSDQQAPSALDVSGPTLAWYENLQRAGSQPKVPHRLNILTGEDTTDAVPSIARPGAFNGESWFTDAVLSFAAPPGTYGPPLMRYRVGKGPGGGLSPEVLVAGVPGHLGVGLAADAHAVLRATRDNTTTPTGYDLDVVDLHDGQVERIAEGTDEILGVALSEDFLVWSTRDAGGGSTIHQRDRDDLTNAAEDLKYVESDAAADVSHLAAGEGGVAYLIPGTAGADAVIVNGATADRVDLPYDASGLAAVGTGFYTASRGSSSASRSWSDREGVYRINTTGMTRVATIPAANLTPERLSLSSGRLRYSDRSDLTSPGLPVYERGVRGDRRASFTEETRLPNTSGEMAFSGARGVLGLPGEAGWQLLDRGVETARIEAAGTPNVSGAYTLIGGRVFRPDGEKIYTEPVPAGTTAGADDLFGSRVVYARTLGDGSSEIWVDDAETKAPTKLVTLAACAGAPLPRVSIWGELVAWSNSCGDRLFVRDLRTGETRQAAAGPVGRTMLLTLSEGTLTWMGSSLQQTTVLDLTTSTLAPVVLPQYAARIAVDDHLIARTVGRRPGDVQARAVMSPLPFQPKYAPRLISALGPLGFTPNGDGVGDTWRPQFDITKPMRSVTLKIMDRTGTRTLARIDGTAPDGSVRDVSWNGLSDKGVQQKQGIYRWTLTGRSDDGDGTLIGADGSAAATGTVELTHS
ncbi:gliding motility-associated C-terminal domain-containing protein [Kineosporia succinea]|uniref:FlgD-like protein n=1 Tax=Kineosporia succinea TaxID=84632 RepID=A0ABT9PCI8_9ACTN|nr:gliding motility-associated C-terminal domain-containing protein [Kineosporia succinea]MDP9830428.1 hypothetical protein [Kineosporia succinea]